MGNFVQHDYVTAILKSPRRVSTVFRRHFFTLVYLPGAGACSANALWRAHGERLHEVSGERLGFVFLHRTKKEVHEYEILARHPSPARIEKRLRGELSDATAIDFVTAESSIVPPSAMLAQQLNITSSLPCILVIGHHAAPESYVWPLKRADVDDVLAAFSTFATAFYEDNDVTVRRVRELEDDMDAYVLSQSEIDLAAGRLERAGRDLAEARSRHAPEALVQHLLTNADLAAAMSDARCLSDARLASVVAAMTAGGQLSSIPLLRLQGAIEDATLVSRSLHGEKVPTGVSLNAAVERLRETDTQNLRKVRRIFAGTFDWDRALGDLESDRRASRLRAHLKSLDWLRPGPIEIELVSEHVGPLAQLALDLRLRETTGISPASVHAHELLAQARGAIDALRAAYVIEIRRQVEIFANEYLSLTAAMAGAVARRAARADVGSHALAPELGAAALDAHLREYQAAHQDVRVPTAIAALLRPLRGGVGSTAVGRLIEQHRELESSPLLAARDAAEHDSTSAAGAARHGPTGRRLVRAPRVLISYSHEPEPHPERVLRLADQLRSDGVDAVIDRYDSDPDGGWPPWMEREIEAADTVVLVCTATYLRRAKGLETLGSGYGVAWEARLIYNALYEARYQTRKFVPVAFSKADLRDHVISPLHGVTRFELDPAAIHLEAPGYQKLFRRLTNQPDVVKPELRTLRRLPPRDHRAVVPSPDPTVLVDQPAPRPDTAILDTARIGWALDAAAQAYLRHPNSPQGRVDADHRLLGSLPPTVPVDVLRRFLEARGSPLRERAMAAAVAAQRAASTGSLVALLHELLETDSERVRARAARAAAVHAKLLCAKDRETLYRSLTSRLERERADSGSRPAMTRALKKFE